MHLTLSPTQTSGILIFLLPPDDTSCVTTVWLPASTCASGSSRQLPEKHRKFLVVPFSPLDNRLHFLGYSVVRRKKEAGDSFCSPFGQIIVFFFQFNEHLLNAEEVLGLVLAHYPVPKRGTEVHTIVKVLGSDEHVDIAGGRPSGPDSQPGT